MASAEAVGTLHARSFFSRAASRVWVADDQHVPTLAMVMMTVYVLLYYAGTIAAISADCRADRRVAHLTVSAAVGYWSRADPSFGQATPSRHDITRLLVRLSPRACRATLESAPPTHRETCDLLCRYDVWSLSDDVSTVVVTAKLIEVWEHFLLLFAQS